MLTLYKMLFFKLKKKKSPFLYGVWQQSKMKSQPNAMFCCSIVRSLQSHGTGYWSESHIWFNL